MPAHHNKTLLSKLCNMFWKQTNVKKHIRHGENKTPEVRHITKNAPYFWAVKLAILMMTGLSVEIF